MLNVCTVSGFNKQPTAAITQVEIWRQGAWLPGVVLGRSLEDVHDCLTLVPMTMPDQAEVTWVRKADLRIPPHEATTGVAGHAWPRSDEGATPGRHRACEDAMTGGHPAEARTARLPLRLMPVPAARPDLSTSDAMDRAGEPGGIAAANPATEQFRRVGAPGPAAPLGFGLIRRGGAHS